jgi:cellulose synthase/poly-beta-1,6-N-acetylglucosamine synthase-like glycosyltransferase
MTSALELAFWGSALLLAHVFAGYPVCMWLMAALAPQPVRKQDIAPTVTVVIAVHDGAGQVDAKLANLAALDYPPQLLDIVIVCDGCRDDTAERCRRSGDPRLRVLEFAERRGKADCLNDGIAVATGDVLLLTDIRQRLAPVALRELVANLGDASVGAVSGELLLEDAQTGFARGVDAYWRYEKLIRHAESRAGSTVGVSGALYAMRRRLFRPLPPGTVLDDVLVPMQVVAAGGRVVFEPLALAWDRPSQHPAQEQKRKIRTLAGNYQLVQLAPWLLSPTRNPLWFRFVSHKLLRLLAPWLLLLLAASSAALAPRHVIYAAAALLLAVGVALVVVGKLLPALGRLAPIRLLGAFFYLNLFSAQALVAFVRNRRLHLW